MSPSLNIRVSRVRHSSDPVFIYAHVGDVDGIKKLFSEGKASVLDVNTSNYSALSVSSMLNFFELVLTSS